jgi:hypothetical protein
MTPQSTPQSTLHADVFALTSVIDAASTDAVRTPYGRCMDAVRTPDARNDAVRCMDAQYGFAAINAVLDAVIDAVRTPYGRRNRRCINAVRIAVRTSYGRRGLTLRSTPYGRRTDAVRMSVMDAATMPHGSCMDAVIDAASMLAGLARAGCRMDASRYGRCMDAVMDAGRMR